MWRRRWPPVYAVDGAGLREDDAPRAERRPPCRLPLRLEALMKRLRCVLLGHKWTRRRVEGDWRVECRRCALIADSSAEWGRIYGGAA